jgi:hypothetical protein
MGRLWNHIMLQFKTRNLFIVTFGLTEYHIKHGVTIWSMTPHINLLKGITRHVRNRVYPFAPKTFSPPNE